MSLASKTLCGLAALALCTTAKADVVFSEIFYNPNGTEQLIEFVEIYNTSAAPVDVSGWYITDGDLGADGQLDAVSGGSDDGDVDGSTSALPGGTLIAPGEAIVLGVNYFDTDLSNGDSNPATPTTVTNFKAAWPGSYQLFLLDGWVNPTDGTFPDGPTGVFGDAINATSNGPSDTNEILNLMNSTNNIVDLVNYDDGSPWPSDSGSAVPTASGSSIFKVDVFGDGNDGTNWAVSEFGLPGVTFQNQVGNFAVDPMFASPGFVDAIPEPTTAALATVALAGLATRRRA